MSKTRLFLECPAVRRELLPERIDGANEIPRFVHQFDELQLVPLPEHLGETSGLSSQASGDDPAKSWPDSQSPASALVEAAPVRHATFSQPISVPDITPADGRGQIQALTLGRSPQIGLECLSPVHIART
ncbi:MAG: hypothetical protein R3C18_17480 [Planctomycetaceae bacterium]